MQQSAVGYVLEGSVSISRYVASFYSPEYGVVCGSCCSTVVTIADPPISVGAVDAVAVFLPTDLHFSLYVETDLASINHTGNRRLPCLLWIAWPMCGKVSSEQLYL